VVSQSSTGFLMVAAGLLSLITVLQTVVQTNSLQARTDLLTSLPNRRALFERFAALMADRHGGFPVGVAVIDIDHFKKINDNFGHAQGDEVLKAVGLCLDRNRPSSAMLARIGGEEFVMLLPGLDEQGPCWCASICGGRWPVWRRERRMPSRSASASRWSRAARIWPIRCAGPTARSMRPSGPGVTAAGSRMSRSARQGQCVSRWSAAFKSLTGGHGAGQARDFSLIPSESSRAKRGRAACCAGGGPDRCLDPPDLACHRLEDDRDFQLGQMHARADMGAHAKAQMVAWAAVDVKRSGSGNLSGSRLAQA
jgi:GGDEF domain-containing protein